MRFKFIFLSFVSALVACAPTRLSTPASAFDGQDRLPAWVNNPDEKYPSEWNLVGLGVANSKQAAENDALKSIAKIFRSKISVDENLVKSVQESSGTAGSSYRNSTNLIKNIGVTANQDLINTKMAEFYFDEKEKMYYVLAVMEKQSTADLVKKDIKASADDIQEWLTAYNNEADALQRFKYLAKIRQNYSLAKTLGEMLPILDAFEENMNYGTTDTELAKLTAESNQACPVFVEVAENFPSQTQKVIVDELTSYGFQIAQTKSANALTVKLSYDAEESESPNGQMKFVHWNVGLSFVYQAKTIAQFEKNGRDGQLSHAAAQKRAELKLAKILKSELPQFFSTKLFN